MSGFANPLDIVEDVVNGNLYVAELNWNDNPNLTAQITLLRAQQTPAPPMPLLAVTASADNANNEQESKNYTISLANKGDGILKVKSIALVSDNVQRFNIANVPLPTNNAPLVLQKNSLINFNVNAKLNLQKLTTAKLIVTSIDGIQKEIALNDGIENDSTKEITNNNLKAVSNLKERRKLIVYPNPNSGSALFVKLVNFSNNEEVNISLYDMMGSMLKSVKGLVNKQGQYDTQFAINSDSKNHFYIIRTTGPSGPMSAKVIVNN
jgi:hypothetical protein